MDLVAQFALDQSRRGLRPATITTRRRILWSLERSLDHPIETASLDEIERWLDSLKLSSRSRYTYLSTVAAFFEFACRHGAVLRNPTAGMGRPRLPRLVPRPAPAADVEYAIAHAEPMMKAWLCLAAYQGLRCYEIAHLRREDVLETHEPPLLVVADGKGGHQAVMTLNDQVELALREYGMRRSGYLFQTRDGNPYSPASVSRYAGKYLRSISVDATMHQLRHLFVSTVWARTKDMRVTQEMARHMDPKTTAGYSAFDKDEAQKVGRSLRLVQQQKLPLES
jgi:integrase/recombinase XerC